MWKTRSGRGFLVATASTTSPAAAGTALLPLPAHEVLRNHRHQLASLQPFLATLRLLLRLPTSVKPSPSVGSVDSIRWRSCSYSSGASPNGGGDAEGGGDASDAVAACWNCGTTGPSSPSAPFLACGACGSVQPVDTSVDYFQIFGLERKYELRSDGLENKYKDWQKKLHPDLVHTKSETERSYAAEQSARVIDAYRTLNRPLSRALYLLKLEGLHVDEEKTISDSELLAEVLEIREAVEEARNSQALEQIKSELQEKLQSWSNSFAEAFKDGKIEDAVTSTQRMRYYERAIEEIVKKL
uniref:Iron-sulfur cluster co-chaperone protein HscB, mitochondrial n=1 Tax=Anthurium amnicola TaxID=1678845 RepID=A0A1D1YB58_9ARAE